MSQQLEPIHSDSQTPGTISCPDLVRRLLERVRTQGYANLSIGQVTRQTCRDYLCQLDAVLKPAPREKVLARIATLMAHYWTPQMPVNLQEAVALDWSEILSDLPWIAVEQAALEWLKTKDRRPTPGQFRKLAEQFIDERYGDRKTIERVLKIDWSRAGDSTHRKFNPGRTERELAE